MALMMGLYDALREANVSEDKAKSAAEEVAGFESAISALRSDMKLMKWMIGAVLALELTQFANVILG